MAAVAVGCAEPDIHPALKSVVDRLEAERDCAGLQQQFDAADAADETGELKYIDDALRDAGCYG